MRESVWGKRGCINDRICMSEKGIRESSTHTERKIHCGDNSILT